MIKLRDDKVKVCETCKKECSDDFVFMSAPTNSRIVCLCSEHAKKLADTCKQYGILFSIY